MVKRYYCDYCDRSFIDDLSSRKKHLACLTHRLARKSHYLKFRDLKTLVEEERAKERCRRFLSGRCTYGENCNYTHYSSEELDVLERQAKEEKEAEAAKIPSVESWLAEWRLKTGSGAASSTSRGSTTPALQDPDLPPSLRPPLLHQVSNLLLTDWG